MKITKKNEFRTVVIEIESQDELNFLRDIMMFVDTIPHAIGCKITQSKEDLKKYMENFYKKLLYLEE